MKKVFFLAIVSLLVASIINVKAAEKVEIGNICTEVKVASKGSYSVGDEYSCDPGDGNKRTFYVLEINGDDISLILDSNIGGTIAWITRDDYIAAGGIESDWCNGRMTGDCVSKGPVTALKYLKAQTTDWNKVTVSMPSYEQVYNAALGNKNHLPSWLLKNLWSDTNNNLAYGYWTKDPFTLESGKLASGTAYLVNYEALLRYNDVTINDEIGVRPVITVLKDKIENDNNNNNNNNNNNMLTPSDSNDNKTTKEDNPNTIDLNVYRLLSITFILILAIGIITKKYKKI